MKIIAILFILGVKLSFSQTPTYWVEFTDKNNSTYSLSAPEDYLSQRALERREKHAVAISLNDLPVNKIYVDSLRILGAEILGTSKWFNASIVVADSILIDSISNYSFVKKVKKARSFLSKAKEKFNEIPKGKSAYTITTNQHYPYGYSYSQLSLHNAIPLMEMGFKGQGVHIAVMDAGFEQVDNMPCFDHLFSEGYLLSTYDFIENDESVYEDHWHGSLVLSAITGKLDGTFYAPATKASYHLLRTEDANSETLLEEYNWIRAAEYADSAGVDIINTSLGYTTFDDTLQNHNYADMNGDSTYIARAADLAVSKGMIVCASAGNSGANSWKYISTPADGDSVLAVGAVDSLGNYAFFSSTGPASDGSIKPDLVSVGWNAYVMTPNADLPIRGNGTSFSAPMLTGMIAILWQALPDKSNMELAQLLKDNASQSIAPDSLLGYGVPDLYKAFSSTSPLRYINVDESRIEQTFPNPSNGEVNVIFNSSMDQQINVRLFNTQGVLVDERKIDIKTGRNQISIIRNRSVEGVINVQIIEENGQKHATKVVVI